MQIGARMLSKERVSVHRAIARSLLCAVIVGISIGVWSSNAAAATQMTAKQLRARIQRGDPIEFDSLEVTGGPLDLTGLHTIKQAIRCRDCVIDGDVLASDVTFSEAVDLEGVMLKGSVDMRGAKFEGPMLARGDATGGGGANGDVDFSFARFEAPSAFDGLSFKAALRFEGAFFGDNTSFVGTTFDDDVVFDRAHFTSSFDLGGSLSATARSGVANGNVSFLGASFDGPANLGQRIYTRGLDVDHIRAAKPVSLADASVHETLSMQGATFDDLDAKTLSVDGPASLDGSQLRDLALDRATFNCSLSMSSTSVTAKATLRGVQFANKLHTAVCQDPQKLIMDGFTAADLSMDQALVSFVPENRVDNDTARRTVLTEIEQSERASGTVADANNAHYALLALEGAHTSGLRGIFEWIYREIGGYLVRPTHPLTALVLLVALGTAIRWIRRRQGDDGPAEEPDAAPAGATLVATRRVVKKSCRGLAGFLRCITDSLTAVVTPTPPGFPTGDNPQISEYVTSAGLLSEYIVSKLLILTFLLSLANFNTTLHDLVNGLFK